MTPPVVYPRQPDWYDKPPVPGWYIAYQPPAHFRWISEFYEDQFKGPSPLDYLEPGIRWFGPIPQDPQESR